MTNTNPPDVTIYTTEQLAAVARLARERDAHVIAALPGRVVICFRPGSPLDPWVVWDLDVDDCGFSNGAYEATSWLAWEVAVARVARRTNGRLSVRS